MPIISKISRIFQHSPISCGSKRCMSVITVVNKAISKLITILIAIHNREINIETLIATNLSTTSISNFSISTTGHLSTVATNNLLAAAPVNLSNTPNSNTATKLILKRNLKAENNITKLEISNDSLPTNPQFINTTIWFSSVEFNNIPLVTVTNNKTLATIFPFKLKETTMVPLFSRAALEKKPITAIYTDVKVDGHLIKLILDSESTDSHQVNRAANTRIIIADGTTKTSIGKINDFPIEVNGIIIPIKLVITGSPKQKPSSIEPLRIPAMCGHFKPSHTPVPLIDLEKEKLKPTWEVYQMLWTDVDHNKLPPILIWDNNNQEKEKGKKELTWNTDQA
ncbi:hypothetical protein G9A89_011725 [Geosiphon pyriformis]|nr:hypothetical protein G9A89_011725 [Geosiphon pyriformis]